MPITRIFRVLAAGEPLVQPELDQLIAGLLLSVGPGAHSQRGSRVGFCGARTLFPDTLPRTPSFGLGIPGLFLKAFIFLYVRLSPGPA